MYYKVADHYISIDIKESEKNSFDMIPSFKPFVCNDAEVADIENGKKDLLFTLVVDDFIRPETEFLMVGDFDIGDGKTEVYLLPNGGYQFFIKNIQGNKCCLMQTDKFFRHCKCALRGNEAIRRFGLNDAIMFAYAFAGSFHQTLLIHASMVSYKGFAYPFIAESGTGKSTHSQLWINNIEGVELMNDDNPVVRIVDGKPIMYGSPWSGKTPCYRQVHAPLGAVTRIDRAKKNSIDRLDPISAFASFLPACSSMKWDNDIYDGICTTVTAIVETTPIYTLHCLPDREAAIVCNTAISRA